jgi:hypothetical protein
MSILSKLFKKEVKTESKDDFILSDDKMEDNDLNVLREQVKGKKKVFDRKQEMIKLKQELKSYEPPTKGERVLSFLKKSATNVNNATQGVNNFRIKRKQNKLVHLKLNNQINRLENKNPFQNQAELRRQQFMARFK